jgi:release factor glutamine methyltransferase
MQIHSNLVSDVIKFYQKELITIYSESELQNITRWVLEKQLRLNATDIVSKKELRVNQSDLITLEQMCYKLKEHTPIQYVLGEAEFYHLKFKVNKNVLIPRPETEELVDLIVQKFKIQNSKLNVLDVGTGSGCIPVSIKKNIPNASVYGLDISDGALDVAKLNAIKNKTEVLFFKADILADSIADIILDRTNKEKIDILISNPPYVLHSEKEGLHNRVKNYEPSLALFVDDADPILFYRKISILAKKVLAENGMLYFECHTDYAESVYQLLQVNGFHHVCLYSDMTGLKRFVSACL